MKIVVTNPKGVTERTGPTTTSFAAKTYAAGVVLELDATISTPNELWGQVKGKERAFVALQIGNNHYCAIIDEIPALSWIQAIDEWARSLGYKGVKPNA